MLNSSTRADRRNDATTKQSVQPAASLESQHVALAVRIARVFERTQTDPPAVTAVGHCVFITHRRTTFSATISGDHLLLLNNTDYRLLGRFSSPAGLCRQIVSFARN